MLRLRLLAFTPASVQSRWAQKIETSNNSHDQLEQGFLFNKRSKILLMEKIDRVELLVLFSSYEFTMEPDIEHFFHRFSTM